MTETEIDALIQLARGHDWIALAAVFAGLLIRLSKSDRFVAWFPIAIAPRWRAWAALVLGVAYGALRALVTGSRWPGAIAGGLTAGFLAITGHELVVEGLRKGRDVGVAKPPPPPPGTIPPPSPKAISLKPPPMTITIIEAEPVTLRDPVPPITIALAEPVEPPLKGDPK